MAKEGYVLELGLSDFLCHRIKSFRWWKGLDVLNICLEAMNMLGRWALAGCSP